MTIKAKLVLLGIGALAVAAFALWYFTTESWPANYGQTNARWRISGLCVNSQDGTPIEGAETTAYFREPVRLRHKLLNAPLKRTNAATTTDAQGRFELVGEGGHVDIKVRAQGYRDPEPWEDWGHSALHGVTQVDTNIVVSLQPAFKSTREAKRPEQ